MSWHFEHLFVKISISQEGAGGTKAFTAVDLSKVYLSKGGSRTDANTEVWSSPTGCLGSARVL